MRTDERDEALAARRDSSARRAVSVECAVMNLTDEDQAGCYVRDRRTVG